MKTCNVLEASQMIQATETVDGLKLMHDKHSSDAPTDIHGLFEVYASATPTAVTAPQPTGLKRASTDEMWESFDW